MPTWQIQPTAITRWILQAHKKSHDRYSKNNIGSDSPFAVERLCPGFGRDHHKTTRSFCHFDSATLSTGLDPAHANSTDGLTDLGSVNAQSNPRLQGQRGLRRRCDLP
jgi:hypothetical protein